MIPGKWPAVQDDTVMDRNGKYKIKYQHCIHIIKQQ